MDTQLYRGINVKALLVRTLKDIWQTQFFLQVRHKIQAFGKMVQNGAQQFHFLPFFARKTQAIYAFFTRF